MPSHFVPKRSTTHRLACLSLYKNLLRRCANILPSATSNSYTTTQSSSSTLRKLVRYRFQHDKTFKNWQQIRNALQFGRGVLQLLDRAATGNAHALEEVAHTLSASTDLAVRQKELLKQVQHESAQQQPCRKIVESKEREAQATDKTRFLPRPDTVPVLQRPVPYEQAKKDKNGNRRVPSYFVVQAVPFLRYSRRHPVLLSQRIYEEIKTYDGLWTRVKEYEKAVTMAEFEDEWDDILFSDGLPDDRHHSEREWSYVPRTILRDNMSKIWEIDQQRLELGAKLWDVYQKEKALAALEKAQKKGKEAGQKKPPIVEASVRDDRDNTHEDRIKPLLNAEEESITVSNFRPYLS